MEHRQSKKENLHQNQIKISSLKSSENTQKKEGGPDRSVSDNQSSSVMLNELAMKARKSYCNFKLQQRSRTMTDINPNVVQSHHVYHKLWRKHNHKKQM